VSREADARPAIADPLSSVARYDVVLLASPLWNVRPPMIMRTFAERVRDAGDEIDARLRRTRLRRAG
jgi:hypothetical protein